jgi:tetratricopeptide (TPR) repeat protein
VDPASIAFAALAEEYRRAGRFEEAIATCRAGLKRHSSYLSARVTLGRSLLGLGQTAAAREELETVLQAAPENLAAIRALAEVHEACPEAVPSPAAGPAAHGAGQLAALEHFLDAIRAARLSPETPAS